MGKIKRLSFLKENYLHVLTNSPIPHIIHPTAYVHSLSLLYSLIPSMVRVYMW